MNRKLTGDEPYYPSGYEGSVLEQRGITIREKFAADFLAALMANPNFNGGDALNTVSDKIKSAVAHADDLIEKINDSRS